MTRTADRSSRRRLTNRVRTLLTPLAVCGVIAASGIFALHAPCAYAQRSQRSAQQEQAKQLAADIEAVLEELKESGGTDAIAQEALAVFDRAIMSLGPRDTDQLVTAAFAHRLARQLNGWDVPERTQSGMATFLIDNRALGHALVFLIKEDKEEAHLIYSTLEQLRRTDARRLAQFPNLAAAVAVVHDQPLTRRINENTVSAPDASEVFDYFASMASKLNFNPKDVPAELLVYTVDVTSPIDELRWAHSNYRGDRAVGERFHEIQYDYAHFRAGATKRVTQEGFTLPNIKQFGGVCCDQAYFAMTVGKAIGVPTAYATAVSGSGGHAWVGYLEARGRRGAWNFDEGRYTEYVGIKGEVLDPQTHEMLPDRIVGFQAKGFGAGDEERVQSAALTDAAARLAELSGEREWPAHVGDTSGATITPSVDSALDVLKRAIDANAGERSAWALLAQMGRNNQLDPDQKAEWAGALMKLCGREYPDFTIHILTPLAETVRDPAERAAVWGEMHDLCRSRPDLAAECLVANGRIWKEAGEPDKAYASFSTVIERYANAGPFALDALAEGEALMRANDREGAILPLYESTWKKTRKPASAMMFARSSNWFRVGARYMQLLQAAGMNAEAARVGEQLGLPGI